ncbi:MAG: polysaccharide deacetylase family protein [Acidobacteriaceae bacterium]|nr:polysaccharide deacetylase family protein [Acidobacteriaceae bacterium]
MFLALALGVTAASAAYVKYGSLAPRSQLYGRTLTQGKDPRQIALTYDDGPNHPYTLHMLDCLAKYSAKATFFLIGKFARQRPEIVRAIHEAGHAIGNHTYHHPNLNLASPARVRRELLDCRNVLQDLTGASHPLFRPPFGARLPHVLSISRALGFTPVMWSAAGDDWKNDSADLILNRVSRAMRSGKSARGEIILLHDGSNWGFGADRAQTVQATERLLQQYSGSKSFVSVPELTI